MIRLVPRAVEEKLHGAGRLAAAKAEGVGDLPGGKTQDPCRGRGSAEHAAGRRRVEAARVVLARLEGDAEAYLNLVSGDDAGDDVPAMGAGHLGRRESRGHDGCASDGSSRVHGCRRNPVSAPGCRCRTPPPPARSLCRRR